MVCVYPESCDLETYPLIEDPTDVSQFLWCLGSPLQWVWCKIKGNLLRFLSLKYWIVVNGPRCHCMTTHYMQHNYYIILLTIETHL